MKTHEKYLKEANIKPMKMEKAFLKGARKKLNQVDNIMRELKGDSVTFAKIAKVDKDMFGGVNVMIGQIIGLTNSIYKEYEDTIDYYKLKES